MVKYKVQIGKVCGSLYFKSQMLDHLVDVDGIVLLLIDFITLLHLKICIKLMYEYCL